MRLRARAKAGAGCGETLALRVAEAALPKQRVRLGDPLGVPRRRGEQAESPDDPHLEPTLAAEGAGQRRVADRDRLIVAALADVDAHRALKRRDQVGREPSRLEAAGDRLRGAAELLERLGLAEPGARVPRVQPQDRLRQGQRLLRRADGVHAGRAVVAPEGIVEPLALGVVLRLERDTALLQLAQHGIGGLDLADHVGVRERLETG